MYITELLFLNMLPLQRSNNLRPKHRAHPYYTYIYFCNLCLAFDMVDH